jgi:hypothetical protein
MKKVKYPHGIFFLLISGKTFNRNVLKCGYNQSLNGGFSHSMFITWCKKSVKPNSKKFGNRTLENVSCESN